MGPVGEKGRNCHQVGDTTVWDLWVKRKLLMEEAAGVLGVAAEPEFNLLGDAVEVAETAHEGVLQTEEVCAILHFLGEDVTWVDFSGDVKDGDCTVLHPFTGAVFAEF